VKPRLVLLLLVAAVPAFAISACHRDDSSDGGARERANARSDELEVSTAGWKTDFAKHSVPLSEFRSGGPGRDGIPPIDDPKFVSPKDADKWLIDREPVLVVELPGEARAYPVQILIWHEIVNDELGGRPIAVTYCPLCNSSVVFDRRVDGRELTFGTTGNLRKSDLVMWDRQTESWWQQLTADAVVGKLAGKRLAVLPSQTLSWADFKRLYPDGEVLSRDTGFVRDYGRNPYEGYDEQQQPFLFDGEIDDRLPAKERVAAVFTRRETAVFPFSSLVRKLVVNEEVGGAPVVVLYKRGVVSPLDEGVISSASADVGTAAAFDRRIDGRTLTFERRGGRYLDEQSGSEWDIAGRAVAGELRGKRLRPVRHDEQYWFALAAFLPNARIVR
jgi:Protein of unknown function (DUF3179)